MTTINPLISVIVPVFCEAANIEIAVEQIGHCISQANVNYEIIFVDDGSTDQSWNIIKTLANERSEVRGARLSRNFGKEYALFAGLKLAKGNAVITIDADMQHPPDLLPVLITMWQNNGTEVVDVVKRTRQKESLFRRINSQLFYILFCKLSGLDIKNATDYKLLDRKVVDALLKFNETNRFYRGLTSWVGYTHSTIEISTADRMHGNTKWSIIKLFNYAFTNIVNFSTKPLALIGIFGLIFFVSAIIMFLISIIRLSTGTTLAGFPTVIMLLLLIGGVMVSSISLIGIYLAKVLEEVKHRPTYLIKEIANLDL